MNGVDGLAAVLRKAVKAQQPTGAMRGVIEGDRVRIGSRSYPFSAAVECHTENGCFVWAQLTASGRAVIVGA